MVPSVLDVTLERTLIVWWSFMWRVVVWSMVLGVALGFAGGVVVGMVGKPELGAAVGALLGWLGSIPVTIVVLRVVLRKHYGDFTIQLVGTR